MGSPGAAASSSVARCSGCASPRSSSAPSPGREKAPQDARRPAGCGGAPEGRNLAMVVDLKGVDLKGFEVMVEWLEVGMWIKGSSYDQVVDY